VCKCGTMCVYVRVDSQFLFAGVRVRVVACT